MQIRQPPDVGATEPQIPLPLLLVRSALGGTLMGLANLVPGISGGTMLLASGVYPRFIRAIAEVSTFRLRVQSLVTLATVGTTAGLGILLLAGVVKGLVVDHRWVMYSLFIGLTLGGVPVVWRLARPANGSLCAGAAGGFLVMAAIALLQTPGAGHGGATSGFAMLVLAGVAGASAMILPGISGGYLLLLLGQYLPILAAVDEMKLALRAGDWAALAGPGVGVVLPVGIGVVVGIVAVSNLLRWLLDRFPKATMGILLGLLFGAVVGLWPFQRPVTPVPGKTVVRGSLVTQENLAQIKPEHFPLERFQPGPGQLGGAVVLVLAGFAVTALVARVGGNDRRI